MPRIRLGQTAAGHRRSRKARSWNVSRTTIRGAGKKVQPGSRNELRPQRRRQRSCWGDSVGGSWTRTSWRSSMPFGLRTKNGGTRRSSSSVTGTRRRGCGQRSALRRSKHARLRLRRWRRWRPQAPLQRASEELLQPQRNHWKRLLRALRKTVQLKSPLRKTAKLKLKTVTPATRARLQIRRRRR